jgi:prepilin-type N-terminal cleavage/methylation domain-containing protein
MNRGFTLIEILIAISIVGLMLTVVLPVSYSMYKNYKDSLEAEKVLMLISSLRRESFLYSKESTIDTKEGRLVVDGSVRNDFNDIFFHAENPIVFYKSGTTSGGRVVLSMKDDKDNTFYININAPFGELRLARSAEG